VTRAVLDEICGAFPGARWTDASDGDLPSWKVGGKIFALIGSRSGPGVSLKTDSIETAEMLIDAGVGIKAPYLHRSWIRLPLHAPEDELRHRVGQSYRIVRASLPRSVRDGLAPFE